MTDAEFTEALHEAFLVGIRYGEAGWVDPDMPLEQSERDAAEEWFTEWFAELNLLDVA